MASRHRRGLGTRLLVLLGASVASLLLVEVALRVAGYDPLRRSDSSDWRGFFLRPSEDPLLGYELTPGARGYGWKTDVEINSFGFRGPEVESLAPPGTKRIAVIGDSVTFGNGLDYGQTYPAQLERSLRASGQRVEVLDLGVGGYDALQAIVYLERVGLALEPDVVVVGYCFNDLGSVSINRGYVEGLRRYGTWPYRFRIWQWLQLRRDRLELERETETRNRAEVFREENREYHLAISSDAEQMERIRELQSLRPEQQDQRERHFYLRWYAAPERIGKLRFAFQRLAALRDQHGFEVVVALLPFLDDADLHRSYDLAYDLVEHESERLGFRTVRLAELVRGAEPGRFHQVPDDSIHLNAAGHEGIAAALERFLTASGWLASDASDDDR